MLILPAVWSESEKEELTRNVPKSTKNIYFAHTMTSQRIETLLSWYSPTLINLLSEFEPPHDKTNKLAVRPAKTQINLGIRPVWSESSLCTQ